MYIIRNTFSFKDTSRVSAIPQLTNQQRWHTLVALPGQHNLVRRDLHGLRPNPLGSSRHYLPPNNRRLPKPIPTMDHVNRGQTLRTRMASAASAAAARARAVNQRQQH